MDLIVEADIYGPSIDNLGNYVDKIPSFMNLTHGLRCPCGTRKDKNYETPALFTSHIKSKKHKLWINNLNLNKSNYFVENEILRETIQNQKLIIAKYEKELNNKQLIINNLLQQMISIDTPTVKNLIEFD